MNERRVIQVRRRNAAPAPDREIVQRSNRLESEVHTVCTEWARWNRTRRLYGAPSPLGSSMELLTRVSGRSGSGPNGWCDATLAAFHLAVISWPREDPARRIFEMHFLKDTRNVKRAAYEVGISRQHWYRTVNSFARRVYQQHLALRQELGL